MTHEYIGSIHLHTTASDGAASYEEVSQIASQAGLNFLIVTDHNVFTTGKDGWYGDVLLLVGEEIHDTERVPEANHYLAFDIQTHIAANRRTVQEVIDEVNAQGGFGFIAHPFEHSPSFTGEPELPWIDWQVTGYSGLEIWNYMSEFKSYLHSLPRALLLIFFPQIAMTGPFRGQQTATVGQDIPLGAGVDFEILSPLRAELRLIRDGELVARAQGSQLTYSTGEGGVYRVEAYRRHLLKRRGWVFTNPIYVTS